MKGFFLIAASLLALAAHAETISKGDVTAELGPDFFLDDASTGGSDSAAQTSFNINRAFDGLEIGPEGCAIQVSGIGWASQGSGTTASQLTTTITYLGANGAFGGGDDVVIGSATDTLVFSGAGEYYWRFDTPITNVIDGANNVFRISFNSNGSGNLRFKTASPLGIKLSAAGTSTARGINEELLADGGFEALTGSLPDGGTTPWGAQNEWNDFDVVPEGGIVHSGLQSLRLGYDANNGARLIQNLPEVNASNHYALTFWTRAAVTNGPSVKVDFRSGNGGVYSNLLATISVAADTDWSPHVLYVSPAELAGHDGEMLQIRLQRKDTLGTVYLDDVSLFKVAASGETLADMQGLPPHFIHPGGGYLPNMFPFVDRFGQYKHATWEEKIFDDAGLIASAVEEDADIAANPGSAEWNMYGGWDNGPSLTATGYFRTEKHAGKWWLVDPLGKLFFSHGITSVDTTSKGTTAAGREHYFDELPLPGDPDESFLVADIMYHEEANAFRKYGADWQADLTDLAHRRVRSWGMNTIAGWSDSAVYLERRTPYCQVLYASAGSSVATGFPDYFENTFGPNVATSLNNALARGIGEDPWCLGIFFHNELEWARRGKADVNDVAKHTLGKGSTQPAKLAFRDLLKVSYNDDINELNTAWGTSYSSWTDFMNTTALPDETMAEADYVDFYSLYAETYYATIKAQFDTYAPNTLYLGSRFTSNPYEEAAAASALHADVCSYHPYQVTPTVPQAFIDADVPVLISEWHFTANDTGLYGDGLRTASNQTERAALYTGYASYSVDHPNLVGIHWFMYFDRATAGDAEGANPGANYQTGFLTICNVPYVKTVEASRAIGAAMYGRRLGSFPPIVELPRSNYPDIENATPYEVAFVVNDDVSNADDLVFSVSSSNTNFIPNAGMVVTGTGTNRVLEITPSGVGHAGAFITITVTDEAGVRSDTLMYVMQGRPALSLNDSTLSWASLTNVGYQVEGSSNLVSWADIGGPMGGVDSTLDLEVGATNNAGFYRLQLNLP